MGAGNLSEIALLSGFIYGLNYFRRKGFTPVQLKIVLATEMLCLDKGGKHPRLREIATQIKYPPDDLREPIAELVEQRFLHAKIPTFGDLSETTYSLGSMGGSMMKRVLDR